MAPRDAIAHVESLVLRAGGTWRADGADKWRSIGLCHDGRSSGSVQFSYKPELGRMNVYCYGFCDFERTLNAFGLTKPDMHDEPRGSARSGEWRPVLPVVKVPEPVIYPAAEYGWRPRTAPIMRCGHKVLAEYLYANAEACVAFGVCRCIEKCFRQWRYDAEADDGRRWSIRQKDARGNVIATVPALPYMLPQLIEGIAAERLAWITEGEKDARRLAEAGLIATCNAEGAGKWTPVHAAYLKGADVRVVADRDEAGKRHALHVVDTLMGVARSIDIVQARHGKDAFDHFAGGGDAHDFALVGEPKPLLLEVR